MANDFVFPADPSDTFVVYDTETSGLPLWNKPSEDPEQPKILQLCAIFTDAANKKLGSLDAVLRWNGVKIEADAAAANGLTHEIIDKYGLDPDAIMDAFFAMHDKATMRIGHNESFDARMVRIFMKQSGRFSESDIESFKAARSFDTAQALRPIMKLPPTEKMKATARFANSFKTPNLSEAYEFCTGHKLEGAHGAMKDTAACRTVFFHLPQLLAAADGGDVQTSSPAPEPEKVEEKATSVEEVKNSSVGSTLYDW